MNKAFGVLAHLFLIRTLLIRNLEARSGVSQPGNPDPQSRKPPPGAAEASLALGAFGALGSSWDYIGEALPPRTHCFSDA